MRILAIESYYGGSHKAFIDGWINNSEHDFDLISFPAYKWKWRMRHTAVSAVDEVKKLMTEGKTWDVIFASDMLGLAEFIGLAPAEIAGLKRVAYFHENQLMYPDENRRSRDMQYAYMNYTTALSADRVWFNTGWHRDEFLVATRHFLSRMPDFRHLEKLREIREKSGVFWQGIQKSSIDVKKRSKNEELKLCWAARWEHDKNPEDLYVVLKLLSESGLKFKINIIGESFNNVPEIFEVIRSEFAEYIDRFGYQPDREAYCRVLAESDIILSTAIHEFFGISVVEGCAHGAIPLAPRRLAYPEVLLGIDDFLYDNSAEELCKKILFLNSLRVTSDWDRLVGLATGLAENYYWESIAARMDIEISEIVNG